MRDTTAIIVGSDEQARRCLHRFLKSTCGLGTVSAVEDRRGGLNYLEQSRFDLVFVDREALGGSGSGGLLRAASRPADRVPIMVVTLLRKLAAFVRRINDPSETDGVPRLENAALHHLLDFARDQGALARQPDGQVPQVPERRSGARDPSHLYERMGHSDTVDMLVDEVGRVAPTDYSVLVVGETGAGKEVVARAIHAGSRRVDGRFVAIDCGAVSDSLVESELFGHVEGAFTGAEQASAGKFRLAHGGTLFLDEISSMSENFQGTILRALEEGSFYPVGGSEEIEVDTRVVAVSNRAVRQMDRFREDLYYRLAEYVIEVPPLRERERDIPHLARRFMQEASDELDRDLVEVSDEAVGLLREHDWPGNVRELRNVIRQAALSADEEVLRARDVDLHRRRTRGFESTAAEATELEPDVDPDGEVSLTEIVQRQKEEVEQSVIRRVMEQTGGNMAETARKLNVDYKTIYRKVREYGITDEEG